MKLTTFLMIIGCIHVSAAGYSQKISLSERNVSLNAVFSKMEKQSGYFFFSNSEFIGALPNVSINIKDATLTEALDVLLGKLSLSYSIVGKNVVITPVTERVNGIQKVIPLLVIGAVLDEQGKPIPGANVKVKGTIQRTVTDQDGKFRILVTADDAVLQISYVGFQPREIPVKGMKNPFVIVLKAVTSDLDQVQVMAYTTTTKRLNTSNTVTITAEEIAKNPVQNVLQVLKDRVPGMFVQQNTGVAGGSFNVNIRGISSFNDNAPLYVIDGVTYPANSTLPIVKPGGNRDQFLGGNALNYLNPADIQSIDILKDADATAIYGSRGAYGVILITTKKAKAGKPRLNVNTNTGLTMVGSFPKLLNTDQYIMLRNEAFKNDGLTPGPGDLDVNGTWPTNRYTNWQKELTGEVALANTVNATYSGGSGNTNFLIGGNYNKQGSIEKGKGSNRAGTIRFDINNTSPDQKFYIDLGGSYSSTTNDIVPLDFSGSTTTTSAPNGPPLYLPDGTLNWETGSNPLSALNLSYKNITNNLLANTQLHYTPVKGLIFTANISFNLLNGNEFRATPTTYFNPATNNITNTTSYVNTFNSRTINFDPNVRYETKLGSKGKLRVIVGSTLQDQLGNQTTITGTNFITDALLINPSSAVNVVPFYSKTVTRYVGFQGSVNYNWDDKYIINLTDRLDGSTKFGPDHRFGNFGAIGGAWLFSEEKWFKENIKFISFAKLNVNYGITGGDGIPNYQYLPRYLAQTTAYQGKSPLTPSTPENPDLHWEQNKKTAVGLNFEFFNGRIGIEANYYKTKSTDLLVQQPLSSTTGFLQYPINTPAIIQNTGFEYTLNTRNIVHKNFSWSSNFTFSTPRNKLVAFPGIDNLPLNFDYVIGKSLNNHKVYNYAGVDPQTGNYFFTTRAGVTGQNLLTLNATTDKTASVDLTPKFYGSVSNTFTYKSFTLDFTFTGRRRTGLTLYGQQAYSFGLFNQNSSVDVLNRWQKPGDITDVPKVSTAALNDIFQQNNFRQSTGAYETITYARLQNLNFAYNFNSNFLKRAHISVLSVFLQGQNLLTISKYGNMDPESLSVTATPPLRVFTAGFNVTL